ncbi:hypothetical protein, conserved [Leishmania tarentolae]|uniref:Calcium uniporter protein C-terminal domain-containing protein n=1 Tax=Leishmania tarentolae TaxID=5689 RepID=A0A640KEX8_LEITA|nr:hypothetical protein, conserved [Leishmania tarentolae]
MLPLTLLRHCSSLPRCAAAAPLSRRCTQSSAVEKFTLSHTSTFRTAFVTNYRLLATATSANTSAAASSSSPGPPIDVCHLRAARDGHLKRMLAAKVQQLGEMERIKAECDELAFHYPDVFMRQLFVFLVLQAAVLFDWTYIHFDWNFVEPITYLIGYSETWLAIAWYGTMQQEFSYESLRRFLQNAKCEKLYTTHRFDQQAYEALRVEVAKLERVMRSLKEL